MHVVVVVVVFLLPRCTYVVIDLREEKNEHYPNDIYIIINTTQCHLLIGHRATDFCVPRCQLKWESSVDRASIGATF